uniref:Salivary triabin n=1 Tax=Triatoma matogrossensis TaxID=162370 RepID=E2J770_9HEMI
MKTFIALTFIGILTYAYAQCHEVNIMENFNATKFLNCTWHVTHTKNLESDSVCEIFEISKTSDNKHVVEYNLGSDEQEIKFRCEAESEEDVKILYFNCTVNDETAFQADYLILDTDYDDYAVFYRCITFESSGSQDDNYLLLRRKQGKQLIPECVTRWISSLGLQECSDLKKSCLK